jgi:hypothetical protein
MAPIHPFREPTQPDFLIGQNPWSIPTGTERNPSAAPDIAHYSPTFEWERKEITEKQASALRRNGVKLTLVQNRGHASVILSGLFAWLEREPASQNQKAYWHFLGHPFAWQLTKREPNRWITQHKAQLTRTL